jgi:hypothetical protein
VAAGRTPVGLFLTLAGVLFTCYLGALGLLLGAAVTARVQVVARSGADLRRVTLFVSCAFGGGSVLRHAEASPVPAATHVEAGRVVELGG